jgi:hypothetical protein
VPGELFRSNLASSFVRAWRALSLSLSPSLSLSLSCLASSFVRAWRALSCVPGELFHACLASSFMRAWRDLSCVAGEPAPPMSARPRLTSRRLCLVGRGEGASDRELRIVAGAEAGDFVVTKRLEEEAGGAYTWRSVLMGWFRSVRLSAPLPCLERQGRAPLCPPLHSVLKCSSRRRVRACFLARIALTCMGRGCIKMCELWVLIRFTVLVRNRRPKP